MDLYRLLPEIVRAKDRLASGVGLNLDDQETILQKIFYLLEQECDTTDELREGLKELYSFETCPVEYFPLLERFLGTQWPAEWPEERRRLVLSAIVKLYHTSGQRLSWVAVLNLFGHTGFFPWELWKETIYEDFDYSLYGEDDGDYYYQYHAARIDIRNVNRTLLALTTEERNMIEYFRPIHVLFRQEGVNMPSLADTCLGQSADVCSGIAGNALSDELALVVDEFSVVESCMARCETAVEPI